LHQRLPEAGEFGHRRVCVIGHAHLLRAIQSEEAADAVVCQYLLAGTCFRASVDCDISSEGFAAVFFLTLTSLDQKSLPRSRNGALGRPPLQPVGSQKNLLDHPL
jgi:hypothetical protein